MPQRKDGIKNMLNEVRAGLFMHYLYEGEKYLARVDKVINDRARIVLYEFEKVKNQVVPEFKITGVFEEVWINELVPIKGVA